MLDRQTTAGRESRDIPERSPIRTPSANPVPCGAETTGAGVPHSAAAWGRASVLEDWQEIPAAASTATKVQSSSRWQLTNLDSCSTHYPKL
jgi:hypothetical protein